MRGSYCLTEWGLGPLPTGMGSKLISASEMGFDFFEGGFSSMLEHCSRKGGLVEGELLGVEEGEDVRPILLRIYTRGLMNGVEFEGDERLRAGRGWRRAVIAFRMEELKNFIINQHEVDRRQGPIGLGFQLKKIFILAMNGIS